MNKIIQMKSGATGDAVAELHAALRALLAHDLLYPGDATSKAKAISLLRGNFSSQTLGLDTVQVLNQYQKERGLATYAGVDAPTANLLNIELMALGLLTEKITTPVLTLDAQVEIRCVVIDSRGTAIAGIEVEPRHEMANKVRKTIAKPQTTDERGTVTFRFSQSSYAELTGTGALNLCFAVRRGQHVLDHILLKDAGADGILQGYVVSANPVQIQIAKPNVVHGRVLQNNGAPASKLSVTLYGIGFGAKKIDLQSSGATDDTGHYAIAFDRPNGKPINLQVVVTDAPAGKVLQSSTPMADAGPLLEVNLQVAAQVLTPEYQRLSADLLPHIDNKIENLLLANEDANRQDLTALNRLTGWDARLMTQAVFAEQLRQKAPALSSEGLYGLLRAGLPSDAELLAQVDPDVVTKALAGATQAGIIGLDNTAIKAFSENFRQFSVQTRLNMKVPGGASSFDELINAVNLGNHGAAFKSIFLAHTVTDLELWETAEKKGIPGAAIKKLQLHGKLSHLVGHSAPLVKHLLGLDIGGAQIADPEQLVEAGFHDAVAWQKTLDAVAGTLGLKAIDLIPASYKESPAQPVTTYCEDLARKVRLSYPTQVTAQLLHQKKISISADDAENEGAYQLLKKASAKQFKLGRQSVGRFLKENMPDLDQDKEAKSIGHLKTLHRLYQITPSDRALGVMAKMNLKSANEVVGLGEKEFIKRYVKQVGSTPQASEAEARQIYTRARQVHSVAQNIAVIVQCMQSQPQMHALSIPAQRQNELQAAQQELLKHFPTMEKLLGSMDYCECEHCRSVLSPAAYLVDLLQLLDRPDNKDASADQHPYKALIQRRPDLPHIPLTCENTNVALPYIDLVNEILEYFVAKNGLLDPAAAHSTEDITTPELLAEPQDQQPDVSKSAYEKLRKAKYPLNLPFDLWTETVRKYSSYCETPFQQLLDVFRPTRPGQPDVLYGGINAPAYGYFNIWAELLGLTPAEVGMFIDADPLAHWHELYGFTDSNLALTELKSAKALSRRLGVSYKELVDLVQTKFAGLDLQEPDIGCNFDHVTVVSAVGDEGLKLGLLKLNLFVRLWRRLAWTIEELDRALQVFIPGNTPFDKAHLSQQPLRTALIYLAHLKTLDEQLPLGQNSRLKWLKLWADFLVKDGKIDDRKLIDATTLTLEQALSGQLLLIQGVVGLTSNEIEYIARRETWNLTTDAQLATKLTAATLTTLYRYSLLAKALKISVSDLLAMMDLSGLKPFSPLSEDPLKQVGEDKFFNQTLEFIKLADEIKESGFTVEDLNYLLLHRFDPVGKYRQDDVSMLALLQKIGAGLDAIEKEKANCNAQPDQPNQPKPSDDDWLARKTELILQTVLEQTEADLELLRILLTTDFVLNVGAGHPMFETLMAGAQTALTNQTIDPAVKEGLTRLAKTLQLAQGLQLSGAELGYFRVQAAQFEDFDIGNWPVATITSTPSNLETKRLAQFRRLASYTRLKSSMTGGAASLIGLFENDPELNAVADVATRQKMLAERIATLTRRSVSVVDEAFGILFGPTPVTFANEISLWRLWQILQMAERFGVAPKSLKGWTGIVAVETGAGSDDPDRQAIARNVRESIRARFDAEAWRRVAQPINDHLRQRRRDALVAFCLQQLGYDRIEQLYEHFLIDPGMEPVVQTSRIRLAISSVQLFIQRILLNLEKSPLGPSTVNAKHWEWMKRYRVWEANRKIFLFPENWLEPEFRDDKTYLFKELEGALLQGDVSNDLAEDAFFNYLKKMDELARLEIVAMHIEDKENEAHRIVHVFGRTYGQPHKYFYRRLEQQVWSAWEPVSAEIEGDHLAPVIWRNRLYLFWVTFMERPSEPQDSAKPVNVRDPIPRRPTTDVDAYLHWSAYQNGEWSTAEASGIGKTSPVRITELGYKFDSQAVKVHVTVRVDAEGAEHEVSIHLAGGGFWHAFLLAGRNASPENGIFVQPMPDPYRGPAAFQVVASTLSRSMSLVDYQAGYSDHHNTARLTPIFRSATAHTLVRDNKGLHDKWRAELLSLQSPIFYQDSQHTFFVQPDASETLVPDFTGSLPRPKPFEVPEWMTRPDWWRDRIRPNIPEPHPEVLPDPVTNILPGRDWVAASDVAMSFNNNLIGRGGLQVPDSVRNATGAQSPVITGGGLFNRFTR